MAKPLCGATGTVKTGSSFSDLFGLFITLGGLIGGTITVIKVLSDVSSFLTLIQNIFSLTSAAVAAYWVAAIATFITIMIVIVFFYYKRCQERPTGLDTCSAGVIEAVFPSFRSASEWAFPFTAEHPRIDVVVKSTYWHLVEVGGARVVCNNMNKKEAERSPILSAFFHSAEVCGTGVGAIAGAAVGGIAGIIVGVIAAVALGCTAGGPFYLLCLLIGLLIVVIVVAVMALVGAFAGGMIGKAGANTSAGPADPTRGNGLKIGDFVTTPGNLILMGDLGGANAYWWVKEGQHAVHGSSTRTAPFSHKDMHPDTPEIFPIDGC